MENIVRIASVSFVFNRASCSRMRAFAGFNVSLAMKPFASYDASARVTRPAALRVLLQLALLQTEDPAAIRKMFKIY